VMDQNGRRSVQIIQTDRSTVGAGYEQVGVGCKDDGTDRVPRVVQQSMILAIRIRRIRIRHIQGYDIDRAILSTHGQRCIRYWIPTETQSQCRAARAANGPVVIDGGKD
jgi:hypothetical protein